MDFQGKVVVVSGAAQGIGAAVSRAMARQGAVIGALDMKGDAVEALAKELAIGPGHRSLGLQTDVSNSASVALAVAQIEEELGPIDILVNVAGILHLGSALEMSDELWNRTFAVNAGGVFKLCREVGARMMARRSGSIVTVASNASSVPRQQMAAYAASKAASSHFTRCLGLELAPYGIRCNVVSPGSTDTEMQRQLWTGPEGAQAVIGGSLESFRLGIPLGRIASAEDIADAVCFLASDKARHITMHDLRVDGGATLGG